MPKTPTAPKAGRSRYAKARKAHTSQMTEERRLLEQIVWKLQRNEGPPANTPGVSTPAKIDRHDVVIRQAIEYLEATQL